LLELAIGIGAFVMGGVCMYLTRLPRPIPPWYDFEETQIADALWHVKGRIKQHELRAATVRQFDRWQVELEIDVSSLIQSECTFSANLRTGKAWMMIEDKPVPILSSIEPSIRNDVHLEIRRGIAECELRNCRGELREIYEVSREAISLAFRLERAIRPHALADAFLSKETHYEREKVLALMCEIHPHHELTQIMLEVCATSLQPVLELAAAKMFEGQRRIALLTKLVESSHAFDRVRAMAFVLLHPDIDPEIARHIAIRLLDGAPSLSRSAAIRHLASDPPSEAPPRLIEIAQHVQDVGTAKELVRALFHIGGELSLRGLELLIDFPGVQRNTLFALAYHGDRSTLGVIHEHLEMLERAGLRREAEAAMADIRRRLGAPEGGRLSLVEGRASGELAVVEPAGGLSFTDD
jgi:hypothetical protein